MTLGNWGLTLSLVFPLWNWRAGLRPPGGDFQLQHSRTPYSLNLPAVIFLTCPLFKPSFLCFSITPPPHPPQSILESLMKKTEPCAQSFLQNSLVCLFKGVICVINLSRIIHGKIISLATISMYYKVLIDRKSLSRYKTQRRGLLKCIFKMSFPCRHPSKWD